MKSLNVQDVATSTGLTIQTDGMIVCTMEQLQMFANRIIQMSSQERLIIAIPKAELLATGTGEKSRIVHVMNKLSSIHSTLNNGYLAAGRVRRAKNELGEVVMMLEEIFKNASETRH